jgi:putative flippase GtrA
MHNPVRSIYRLIHAVATFFLRDPSLFLKYIAVGGASAIIEFSLFSLFYVVLAWPLLVANSCALAITLLFHFNMQKRWTFRDSQTTRRQLPRYLLMVSIAAVMNNALMYLFVVVFGIAALLAKVMQIGLVFGFTFSFSRLVVFPPDHRCI